MLLYDSPVSGNCYKVRLLFAHLGIAYQRRTVDVVDRSNRPELLGGKNPALRVPTLIQDDGRLLTEYARVVKKADLNANPALGAALDQAFHFVALFLVALLVGQ